MSLNADMVEVEINAVIESPATSRWLKTALTDALYRGSIFGMGVCDAEA